MHKVLTEVNIVQPIPPEVGKLQFKITRKKSIMGNLTPTYNLYLEVNDSKKFLIMKG